MEDSFDSKGDRPQPAGGSGASPSDESILAGLGEADWSQDDAVAYEVALDIVNEIIGAYSGLIGREEASPSPDATRIAAWRQAKLAWARRRNDLSPADPQTVQAVRLEGADLLRTLSDRP